MGCCSCCQPTEAMVAVREDPPRPRYYVSANKSSYISENFDDLDSATARAAELLREGYTSVNFRDTTAEEVW